MKTVIYLLSFHSPPTSSDSFSDNRFGMIYKGLEGGGGGRRDRRRGVIFMEREWAERVGGGEGGGSGGGN